MTIYASNFPIVRAPKDKKPVKGWGAEQAEAALKRLESALPGAVLATRADWGQVACVVARGKVHDALALLRDDAACAFDTLIDLSCIDYLGYPGEASGGSSGRSNVRYAGGYEEHPERFAVHYVVYATAAIAWLRIKSYLPEGDPTVPTASDLWAAADWAEREASEMYGVVFKGHPNPRKLLLPDDYQGFPLRKDYPLRGRGERENFPRYSTEEEDI